VDTWKTRSELMQEGKGAQGRDQWISRSLYVAALCSWAYEQVSYRGLLL